jgi:2-C-methyl-D-erythritol 4-phosphate cytidylyltransferase
MQPLSRVGVVVVAAGRSSRMGGMDKIFAPLLGAPLISYTLDQFEAFDGVWEIVLVLGADALEQGRWLVQQRGYQKVSWICAGGERRQDSVRLGLEALQPCQWVIVHDGARPCLDRPTLQRGLVAAQEVGAAVAGVPVKDTIKVVSPQGLVQATPSRDTLWSTQTPQIFRYELLREAHSRCTQPVTDDAAMVESLGCPVKMFLGSYENLKVTTPDDLVLAEALLRSRAPHPQAPSPFLRLRSGQARMERG